MTTTLARARALIEAAEKATAAPWATLPSPDTGDLHGGIVSPKGDAELGNWMIASGVRWAENRAFIATSRNDAPDIARALVEAADLMRELTALPPKRGPVGYLGVFMRQSMEAKDKARAFLAQHDGE